MISKWWVWITEKEKWWNEDNKLIDIPNIIEHVANYQSCIHADNLMAKTNISTDKTNGRITLWVFRQHQVGKSRTDPPFIKKVVFEIVFWIILMPWKKRKNEENISHFDGNWIYCSHHTCAHGVDWNRKYPFCIWTLWLLLKACFRIAFQPYLW